LSVLGFFTLPSEKTEAHTKERPTGKRTEVRPAWIMPLICALFALLAWMLWISVNA
jgi:paraquat-inducible protein B